MSIIKYINEKPTAVSKLGNAAKTGMGKAKNAARSASATGRRAADKLKDLQIPRLPKRHSHKTDLQLKKRKLITYVIPCYNSEEYMDRCIASILACGADDIEVIIVDDGSTKDSTWSKALYWSGSNPDIVRAIRQENGGHGAAVMKGLMYATGTYFKVVDSDDWLDDDANCAMLAKLREFEGDPLDLMIVNYVYEHVADGSQEPMRFHHVLPRARLFTWDEIGHFGVSQYILMHSIVYRTEVLRQSGLELPRHTFYVDNIFAYIPLPSCERLYYLDVDLYRYYIGREDQSVNEQVMVGRIEQQIRITRIMIEAFHLYEDVAEPKLRAYMMNYLNMMLTICSIFSMMSDREDKEQLREEAWQLLEEHDPQTYAKLRKSFMGRGVHLPGKKGDEATMAGYRLAQALFKFN